MTSQDPREGRLRALATREGYRLRKAPRRDPRAGTYMIVDSANEIAWGDETGYGMTLDEIEAALTHQVIMRAPTEAGQGSSTPGVVTLREVDDGRPVSVGGKGARERAPRPRSLAPLLLP